MSYPEQLFEGLSAPVSGLVELSHLQGPAYLQGCAEWLQRELGVLAVSIAEIEGVKVDRLGVLGFCRRDGGSGPDRYTLDGTPCLDVLRLRQAHCVRHGVSSRYRTTSFPRMHIESYAGVPLRDRFGQVFGLVSVFDDTPMAQPARAVELLEWFAGRIGNEAEIIRTRRSMLNAAHWMATTTSDEVFARCAANLCEAFQVTSAFLMEWDEDRPGEARFLTVLHEGQYYAAFAGQSLDLRESPFAGLLASDVTLVAEDLLGLYPDCEFVRLLGVQGILGVVVRDPAGLPIGHIGIGHDGHMSPGMEYSPVFSLYVARVAMELERARGERERTEAERTLSVKHKLESIGLMAGHIAHDFNNLLMAILGNANLAAEVLEEGSPVLRFIRNIEAASTSAGDVVGQLLDYAGRPSAPLERLEVTGSILKAGNEADLSCVPGAVIAYELAADLPLVEVDRAQLQQIMVNLLLNAAQATASRPGVICVRTGVVELRKRQIPRLVHGRDLEPGEYVLISVSDEGEGMDDATLARIFDPFFSSRPNSRGLGLAAVRGFVQACGGGLSIRTVPGSGTTISLYLVPAGLADVVTDGKDNRPADASSPCRVLVVDDDPSVAEVVAGMLEAADHEVRVCGGGEEALAALGEGNFDCVVLDVRMPEMDGWTTLARLRDQRPELPAVMMTGYADETPARQLDGRLGTEILYKPFAGKTLLLAVSEAVSSPVLAEPP